MPEIRFKKKDTPAKSIRKGAEKCLDALIAGVTQRGGKANDPAVLLADAYRLDALIELIQIPLGKSDYKRERLILDELLERLGPLSVLPEAVEREIVAKLPARDQPAETIEAGFTRPAQGADAIQDEQMPQRLLDQLGEMRMRARYWHLPDEGFAVFAAGLRQSYHTARQRHQKALFDPAFVQSLRRLSLQLEMLKRVWRAVIEPVQAEAARARQSAERLAILPRLRERFVDDDAAIEAIDEAFRQANEDLQISLPRLFAEPPAAFVRRINAYWDAWQQPTPSTE